VPARAKLNFAVNKPPKLPHSSDIKEQTSLWRRFVYVDCPMQFVDFSPESKDKKKIDVLRSEMPKEKFRMCVKQVDLNIDSKLNNMTSNFFKLFATAMHGLFVRVPGRPVEFRAIQVPACIQDEVSRMMRANPSLRADDFLNTVYDPGVLGDMPMRDMFRDFLASTDLEESNFPFTRFEADVERWLANQNNFHPVVKQSGLQVRKTKVLEGPRKGDTVLKNLIKNPNLR
jgi:hypothetical protein